tara:strand:+ start:326 stop:499 length:174 start_codon:yes stop_codon:yes gene_type:complete
MLMGMISEGSVREIVLRLVVFGEFHSFGKRASILAKIASWWTHKQKPPALPPAVSKL